MHKNITFVYKQKSKAKPVMAERVQKQFVAHENPKLTDLV